MRYLVRGYPLGKIAAHLGISRHTIKRWKRDGQFVAAMDQLRREMTAAIISPAARATPPPPAMHPLAAYGATHPPRTPVRNHADTGDAEDPDADDVDAGDVDAGDDADLVDEFDNDASDEEMSDEEAADTEAWIEQIIAAQRQGTEIPPPPPPRRSV